MTPEQFVYWLHGFFELEKPDFMNSKQVFEIQKHLDQVFNREPPRAPLLAKGGLIPSTVKEIKSSWPDFGTVTYTYWDDDKHEFVTVQDQKFNMLAYDTFCPASC